MLFAIVTAKQHKKADRMGSPLVTNLLVVHLF